MSKLNSPSRPHKLRSVLGVTLLALALLVPASASAWVREAAPAPLASGLEPRSNLTLLPDGSAVYLARGANVGSDYTTQLVRRPPGGPAAFASPFAGGLGQYASSSALQLSPPDAAGNLLVVRPPSPTSAAFLPLGGDPAASVVESTPHQVTAIGVAPSGEAAAIVSKGSEAGVSFRSAGPAGRFDTPRWLDRAGNQRSYGIAITVDPDGGVFVLYETEQQQAMLQAYAPPGGSFGSPQLVDVDQVALSLESFRYAQSSNGNGLLVWDEDIGGNSNSERIWALTRTPGGLLGNKTLVTESPNTSIMVAATYAGITDDGSQYVGYIKGSTVSGCPTNIDGDAAGVLAFRSAMGGWVNEPLPAGWPNRGDVAGIVTAGNAVAVATTHSIDSGNRCEESDPSVTLSVRTGTGASLGPASVIATDNITHGGKTGSFLYLDGFSVNAGGAVIALVDEPSAPGVYSQFIHYLSGAPVAAVPIAAKKLPAPGKVMVGGKLIAREGRIEFLSSCTRLPGEGSKLFCTIGADVVAELAKHGAGASAVKGKGKAKGKGKKKAAKLQVLAKAKPVKVPVGKQRKIGLTLNKLGKKRLAAAGKGGLKVKLRVTITKGSQKQTIVRKVKLVQGKAKGKGKGKAAKGRGAKK